MILIVQNWQKARDQDILTGQKLFLCYILASIHFQFPISLNVYG